MPRKASRWTARACQAQTVISSTHQYPDGTMTTLLQRAASQGWPLYTWCWQETLEHLFISYISALEHHEIKRTAPFPGSAYTVQNHL